MLPSPVLAHFRQYDQVLFEVLQDRELGMVKPQPVTDPEEYFARLCDDIISQQLANAAAKTIFGRFTELFPDGIVSAEKLLELPDTDLRSAGLSGAKAKSVKDLARHVRENLLSFQLFPDMNDETLITELIKVRGIGRWTAEMFLLFTMGRDDIFSFGDLGLRRGFAKLYGFQDDDNLDKQMKKTTALWSPYRSYGSLALWRHYDRTK